VAALYAKHVVAHCKGDLIDLGCGKVPLYGTYRNHVTTVTCTDWQNSLHESIHIDVVCDLRRPLPFKNSSFDTAIMSDVLEHLPHPDVMWIELSRVMRPGGKVLLSVPFFYWLHEGPHDYYRYTEWALRHFAASSDFDVLVLEPIGGSPEVVADILAKHLQHVPWLGGALACAIQATTARFTDTAVGQIVSRRTAAVFPYGYFLVAARRMGELPAAHGQSGAPTDRRAVG
jgi:SAM-dependent methyltransferase